MAGGLELHRVPDLNAADFKAKLDRGAVSESALDAAVRLQAVLDKGVWDPMPDNTLIPRYERYLALARKASVAELDQLPVVDQAHVLRLRALYAREIAASTNAGALIAADFKRDYFMLRPFTRAPIGGVSVDPAAKKASITLVVN